MRDDAAVRTTLDLDEDVLQAAKELAQMHGRTAGQVLSDLARQALAPKQTQSLRNGVPVLPRRPGAKPVTMDMVNRLRDAE
jgi:hypothetical protein